MKIYHRKYPDTDWDYRAVSEIVDGTEVIYYHVFTKGVHSAGVETYSGRNYLGSSNRRSYSRRYELQEVPKKYRQVVQRLANSFNKIQWSKENYVNLN